MEPQVLIVGAGPTGLALALGLQKQGIPFRIIDKNAGPGMASRAMVVHARTLELYHQFGLAELLIQAGIQVKSVQLYKDAKPISKVELGEKMVEDISPFPYVLSLAQDEHEAILIEQLKHRGVNIEWETELLTFQEANGRVHVVTQRHGLRKEASYDYLCGCDGAHSTVRKTLGLNFPGGTYQQVFYVADVKSKLPLHGMGPGFSRDGFCLTYNIRDHEHVRLIGMIPKTLLSQKIPSEFTPLIPYVEKIVPVKIVEVNWYSHYKVHHRVSERFRVGNVFLAGDAGHIHSPAGGQGLNTGIGDAFNLAWKLAAVLQKKADESILDSYEQERLSFAKNLVVTTDRLFKRIVKVIEGRSLSAKFYKEILIPHILSRFIKLPKIKKTIFKSMSQTQLNYRNSMLSAGKIGDFHGGDRLPWLQTETGDNFRYLQSVDWQLHVYGESTPALHQFANAFALPLYEEKWTTDMEKMGIVKNSVFLVRPDGYIAVADNQKNIHNIQSYIRDYRIIPFRK